MADTAAEQGPGAGYNFQLYRYTPSLPAAAISLVVFAILTGLHTWRLFRARAFYFISFTVGGLCEFRCLFFSESSILTLSSSNDRIWGAHMVSL